MMECSDDSDGSQRLDGLPRHWPREGVHNHQAQAAASISTSLASAHSGETTQAQQIPPSLTPGHAGPLPPTITDNPVDPPPQGRAAAETYGGEPVVSPENLNKVFPEESKAPEHTDNPEDLKEHLSSVPPVSTPKCTASAALEDPGVKDLGWRDDVSRPDPLIIGVDNESLFTLIRRFNKQVHHVRAIPHPPSGLLDLEIATDEEFSPDKLRATLERLYMTVIVGTAAFGKHVARLRSWNEPRRTAAFALVYFTSWHLSLLSATLLSTLLLLTFSPHARRALFPPAPLAAVSAASGNLQVPRAGTVDGSDDSLTGAPEAHRGEAVEQEASHFVASIAAIGTGTVLGQGGAAPGRAGGDAVGDNAGEMEAEGTHGERASEDSFAGALPDPSDAALKAKNAKDTVGAQGGGEDPAAAVAKKSVEGAVWERMRPVMRILADLADGWERVANALEPVPPFPKYAARVRMAAVVVPLLVASLIISAVVVLRGVSFFVGIVFFSQPVLSRAVRELNRRAPRWRERVELRRTILRGVPTNAQLTLTLLRIGEQANAPLPPPPIPRPSQTVDAARAAHPGTTHSPQMAEQLKEQNFAFDTDNYEVEGVEGSAPHAGGDTETSSSWTDEGTHVDESCSTDHESIGGGSTTGAEANEERGEREKGEKREKRKKRGSKLVGFLKKTTRAGVGGVLGVDHLKAKAGDEHARRRLGAVGSKGEEEDAPRTDQLQGKVGEKESERETTEREGEAGAGEREREGPTSFSARVHGKKGRVLVVSCAASPCVSFVAEKPLRAALGKSGAEGIEGEFSVGVAEIVALRKVGGFGWKGKLVVGWATGRDVLDGLEIVDRWGGRRVITAVKGRDKLFNRLVAMGAQQWECL